MKKFKRFLTLLVGLAMTLCVFAMAACTNPDDGKGGDHVCEHVCEECGKCTDNECDAEVCEDKCPGHGSVTPGHECEDVCEECGGCLTECTEPECEDKCPGHGSVTPGHECEDKCEECDGCLTECTEPECANKCPGHGSVTPGHECEDKCEECGLCTSECEEPECSEKCPKDHPEPAPVYTITLVVGEGTLPANAKTEYKTNADGMLDIEGYLPLPTANTAHWHFLGWFTEATGGDEVIEDETVFLADGNIYAQYGRDNGLWSGENLDVWKGGLSQNTGASGSGLIAEYWLGGGSVSVEVGEKLAVAMNGKLIDHYLWQPVGVEAHKTSGKNDYVTVTVAGDLKVYAKLYEHATDPDNWTVEWAGATKVETGSDIPVGCDAINVTWGTNSITFYLVDVNGAAVGKDRFSQFCIYTFNGELFGDWGGSTTKGVLAENMTSTNTGVVEGWIFRWGSGFGQQTKNITGLKSGKSYLVELKGHQVDAVVTELELG